MRELMKHLHKYVKLNFNIPLNSKENCRRILKIAKRKLGHRVPIKKRIGIIKSFLSRHYNLYHIRQSRNLRFSQYFNDFSQYSTLSVDNRARRAAPSPSGLLGRAGLVG